MGRSSEMTRARAGLVLVTLGVALWAVSWALPTDSVTVTATAECADGRAVVLDEGRDVFWTIDDVTEACGTPDHPVTTTTLTTGTRWRDHVRGVGALIGLTGCIVTIFLLRRPDADEHDGQSAPHDNDDDNEPTSTDPSLPAS